MRNFLVVALIILSGCGPLAIDFGTISWGSNQTVERTTKIVQKQTKAQTEAQVDIVEAIVEVLPVFAATPAPTPQIPRITSVTIEMESSNPPVPVLPTPTPKPVIKKKLTAKPKVVATPQACSKWICADTIQEQNCICSN